MLTKFYNQISDYNTINTDFSTFYAYINDFQNKSTDLKSCSIFRTDMLIFSNTICFKTVRKYILLMIQRDLSIKLFGYA